MSLVFDCADPRVRGAIATAARAVACGQLVVLPTDTVYGIGADAFDSAAVARTAGGEGTRPRHAGAGARRLVGHDRRTGQRRPGPGPRPDRGVLARRADAGRRARAVAGLGPRRRPRHGRGAHAAAPGRHRTAGQDRSDGGVERQRARPAARADRPSRPASSSARRWRCTSTAARRGRASPPRSSTSPREVPRILRAGAVAPRQLRAWCPDIVGMRRLT